ncbi:alpha-L-rhamnosidase C-terminal domain-containing protein [Pedobacter steynii]|nr:alpha-L-rhamnosidase C-terminal domain-containing protein [Pedobacter steynii]
MYGTTIGYPLKITATFRCNDQTLKRMWTLGCRHIQYALAKISYDAPYHEQSQYTGETPIQALTALYLSGEEHLIKKVILDFYHSRSSGPSTSQYESGNRLKVIPTFSLFWVSMIYDYWMHRKDDIFITQFLPAIQGILDWHERQIKGDQETIGIMNWWTAIDFDKCNGWGNSLGSEGSKSAILSLQYAYTLEQAAKLFIAFGDPERAKRYTNLAENINNDIISSCFCNEKALIADSPEKLSYSQHANIWAILSNAVKDTKAKELMVNLLEDKSIQQTTFYYKFYLILALKKTGLHEHYYARLKPETPLLSTDLLKIPEELSANYSDRNEWGTQPNYDFLTTICGITPAAPAFERIRIQPVMGDLLEIEGSIKHPQGSIVVKYQRIGKTGIRADIDIPESLQGDFLWNNKILPLRGGKQMIEFSLVSELIPEY